MSILKLKPSYKNYIWGGSRLKTDFNKEYSGDILAETWELSSHPDGPSIIMNGVYQGKDFQTYLNEEGQSVLGTYCTRFESFPILIKFIDAKDNLSIQVHPDNTYALKHEGQYGKTEMWYVCDCEENAYLYYGFCKNIDEKEFIQRIEENTLLEVLNAVPVQKGDVFFIEAGTIHAIGKNIVIAEIQQNSNVTYRVYDYGRIDNEGKQRELHIDKAVAVTNKNIISRKNNATPHLAQCDYFIVDKLYIDDTHIKKIEGKQTETSFMHILIVEGNGIVSMNNEILSFRKGDSLFIPAGSESFTIEGACEALITTIGEK